MKDMFDTPEKVGISPVHIANYLRRLEDIHYELHSLMICRHGRTVFARAAEPFTLNSPHRMLSAAKGIIAAAVFFAIDEGKLSLDDKVIDYFADKLPERLDTRYRRLTVYDLLTMQSGQETDAAFGKFLLDQNVDLCREFFCQPMDREPGTHFFYNNSIPHLLFYLAERATGQGIEAYLEDRLCKPLGIHITAQYNELGVYDPVTTVMSANDFLCLTRWFMQEGSWEGRQLIDPAIIRMACGQQSCPESDRSGPDDGKGYGMQLWRNAFGGSRMDGGGGQMGLILPEHDMAVTIMGNDNRGRVAVGLFYEEILSKMKGRALPDDPEGTALLARQAARMNRAPLDIAPESASFAAWNGTTFTFDENDGGLEAVTLAGDGQGMRLTVRLCGTEQSAAIGLNGQWAASKHYVLVEPNMSFQNSIYGPDPESCFLSGGWQGGDFLFTLKSLASMGEYQFCLHCENGRLSMTLPRGVTVGSEPTGGEITMTSRPAGE